MSETSTQNPRYLKIFGPNVYQPVRSDEISSWGFNPKKFTAYDKIKKDVEKYLQDKHAQDYNIINDSESGNEQIKAANERIQGALEALRAQVIETVPRVDILLNNGRVIGIDVLTEKKAEQMMQWLEYRLEIDEADVFEI